MMVFFVIVLVLVAGAVPSHGRTESEDTVFNMTQPHESMNNGTFSSSKLVCYGDLHLVLQWPESTCIPESTNYPCHQLRPGFTVHGLWPQYCRNDPQRRSGGIDCRNRGYRTFNRSPRPRGHLRYQLNRYWPDLTMLPGHNDRFWGHEYNRHGSCTFQSPYDYFFKSLGLAIPLLNQLARLSTIGHGPRSSPYLANDFRDAVQQITHSRPLLYWVRVRGAFYLKEITFRAVQVNGGIQLHAGFPYVDYGNRMVMFPST